MPILNKPRWELFARQLAFGATPADAYRSAGYTCNGKTAARSGARLAKLDCVRERAEELRAENLEFARAREARAAAATKIDHAWVVRAGTEVLDKAIDAEDFDTASRMLETLARVCGLWRERPSESNARTVYVTEEEWEEMQKARPQRRKRDPLN